MQDLWLGTRTNTLDPNREEGNVMEAVR